MAKHGMETITDNVANTKSNKKLYFYIGIALFVLIAIISIFLVYLAKKEEIITRFNYAFVIKDVEVKGASDMFEPTVYTAMQEYLGDKTFEISLEKVRQRIKELPFIYDVSIRRVLPSKLEAIVTEKHPPLIWQDSDGKYYVLNEKMKIIGSGFPMDRENRIVVLRGKDALDKVYQLLSIVALDRGIFQRIDLVSYSAGSWTVLLKGGIIIKLPEKEILESWNNLVKSQNSDQVLDREVSVVDLRIKNKIILTPLKSNQIQQDFGKY